jgi:PAS domain-containing protein
MRDEHRPKQELIHEITSLRKQVGDLRDAMAARRRVEDALRGTATMLRDLTDAAPVGLGLFRLDGTLLTANQRLASMLGYQTAAELQSVGAVLGVFASPEDRARVLSSTQPGEATPASFRSKDGCRRLHRVIAGGPGDSQGVVLAIFECGPDPVTSTISAPSA